MKEGTLAIRLFGMLVACLVLVAFQVAAQSYSRSVELLALRISYNDLQSLLSMASSLMNSTNAPKETTISREGIELRDGELKVNLPGHRLTDSNVRLPKAVDEFRYSIETRNEAPVTSIEMQFNDFRRTLTVQGSAPDQVDAVFSTLRDDIVRLSSIVGGFGVNFVARILLPIVFGSIAFTLLIIWLQTHSRQFALPFLVAVACTSGLLLVPTEKLLAGFLAVDGDPSFMVRFGPEISLGGLVIGVVALPLSYLISRPATAPTSSPESPNTVQETRRKRRAPHRGR